MKKVGTKTLKAQEAKNQEFLSAVVGLSHEKLSKKLTDNKLEVLKFFAEIDQKSAQLLPQLKALEETIALKKEELKTLYQIEVKAQTLDDLNEELIANREALEGYEQIEKERQSKDREIWAYNFEKQKLNERDAFEVEKRLWDRELDAREAALKSQEDDLKRLKQEEAAWPVKLDAELKKNTSSVQNLVEKEWSHKMTLLQKDFEARLKVAEEQNNSLKHTCGRLEQTVKNLEEKLSKASSDVMTISQAALQASAGKLALETLQQSLPRETAKSGSK